MISGAHAIVYSKDPEKDREFLRDILRLPNIDVGGGWLIFGLPPSEVAVHPADENGRHELYFLVDDVRAFIAEMRRRDIACSAIHQERWGRITEVTLPGGGKIGVYEPLHARPPAARPAPQRAASPAPKAAASATKAGTSATKPNPSATRKRH